MKRMTGVATLPADNWISFDRALSWICFDLAAGLDQLLDGADPAVALMEDQIRGEFQVAWRQMADEAAKRSLEIRGRRERARQREQFWTRLSNDDLFNCRFLDIVLYPEGRTILVSRHDRDGESVWEGIWNEAGWDYTELLVRRDDLLTIKSRARPKQTRRKTSRTTQLEAAKHAKAELAARESADIRKQDILADLSARYALTRYAAQQVWNEVTADRPDLRQPGRRKRTESNRTE
jgi:hypothetical protein